MFSSFFPTFHGSRGSSLATKTAIGIALAVTCAAGLITSTANASVINLSVTNPGFEDGNFTGWTASGTDVTVQSTTIPNGGSYNAQIASDGTSDGVGQGFTSPLIQAGTYVFSGDLAIDSTASTKGYAMALLIGTSSQLSNGQYSAITLVNSGLSTTAYTHKSVTWTVASGNSAIGQNLAFAFGDAGSVFGLSGGNLYADNAGVTFTPVPEPATLGLAGIGAIGLLLTARKCKSQV